MPIGVLINCFAVLLGGIIGGIGGKKMPQRVREALPKIFGFSAITLGIVKILETRNLTVVILALILGTIIGEILKLEDRLDGLAGKIISIVKKDKGKDSELHTEMLVIVLIAFCVSGTGIYGALLEGFTGDASILLSKSVLDFFTSIIFGSVVGYVVALISIPQICISLALYFGAKFIAPVFTSYVLGNFLAIGGAVTMIFGFKMADIVKIRAANVMPSLLIVLLLSLFIQ